MSKVKTIKRFQTFSAGGGIDTQKKKDEEKLLPTGIKKEEDEDIQSNKEALYPLGVGLNKPQNNQDEQEATQEALMPAGVNPKS